KPRPSFRGDESRAVFQCGTGDADVDGGVQRLIERAEHGRWRGHRVGIGTFVDDELVVDDHLIEHDLAARRAPLTEGHPAVQVQADPWIGRLDEYGCAV